MDWKDSIDPAAVFGCAFCHTAKLTGVSWRQAEERLNYVKGHFFCNEEHELEFFKKSENRAGIKFTEDELKKYL